MGTKKKKALIPEENFKSDFAPLSGFYDYHVKNKTISLSLDEVQGMGVLLKAMRRSEMAELESEELDVNTICFSSSQRNKNVKNLFWTIRCLVAHPENIKEVEIGGVKCYSIFCTTKENDKRILTMKGVVNCNVWSSFIKQITNKIKETEK